MVVFFKCITVFLLAFSLFQYSISPWFSTISDYTHEIFERLLSVNRIKKFKKVFTRDELLTAAFDNSSEIFERTIDAHIKNLRSKLEKDKKNPEYILTVFGIGYRFGGE